jgi:hypothetical protein
MSDRKGETPPPEEVLRQLGREEHIDGAVGTDASITGSHTEAAEIKVTDTLTVSEQLDTAEYTLSEYNAETRNRAAMSERYDAAPGVGTSTGKTVEFIDADADPERCSNCSGEGHNQCPKCAGEKQITCTSCGGDTQVSCGNCRNGRAECNNCGGTGSVSQEVERQCSRCGGRSTVDCPDCGGADDDCSTCYGDGTVDCADCRGTGTTMETVEETCRTCNGEQRVRCAECSGSGTLPCSNCNQTGTIPCPTCDAEGRVTCRVCDGDGKLVTATIGTLEFEHDRSSAVGTDRIPTEYIEVGDGALVNERRPVSGKEPERGGYSTYSRRVREYEAPVRHVDYEHDGEQYDVTFVGPEGSLRYSEFPTDPGFVRTALDNATPSLPKRNLGVVMDAFSLGVGAIAAVVAVLLVAILDLVAGFVLPAIVVDGIVIAALLGGWWLCGDFLADMQEGDVPDLKTLSPTYDRADANQDRMSEFREAGWNYDDSFGFPPRLSLVTPLVALAGVGGLWVTGTVGILPALSLASLLVALLGLRVGDALRSVPLTFEFREKTKQHVGSVLGVSDRELERHVDDPQFGVTAGVLSRDRYESLSRWVAMIGAGGGLLLMVLYGLFAVSPGALMIQPETFALVLLVPLVVTVAGMAPLLRDYGKL